MITVLSLKVEAGQETISLESKYKASFIHKFAQYIRESMQSEVCKIGIYGNDVVLTELKELLKVKNDQQIKPQQVRTPNDLKGCGLVFLSGKRDKHFFKIADLIQEMKTVCVADTNISNGVKADILFYHENNHLKFKIDKKQLALKDFKNKQLLGMAYE